MRRCLVLGSRAALDRIEGAIEHALAALDLERAAPPSPSGDLVSELRRVDVILAEVTKPSPAAAFELGIARAVGVPIAYIATEAARVSPVFGQVAVYDPKAPRLGYRLATILNAVLPDGEPELHDDSDYRVGERLLGVITHIDHGGGYVLVNVPRRRSAMLHVSNMAAPLAETFVNQRVRIGDLVHVEVVSMDRAQVQLRNPPPDVKDVKTIAGWAELADVVRLCARIELALATAEFDRQSLLGFDAAFAQVRHVRNRLTHGELVSDDELSDALAEARALVAALV